MPKNRLFHPLDLVFPIGLGALGLALGVWSLFSDAELIGKIIAMATGFFFAAMIPLLYIWRTAARKAEWVYKGVRIRRGKKNKPVRVVVNAWIDWVIHYWSHGPFSESNVLSGLDGLLLVFVDKEKLSLAGRYARGYFTGSAAVVGYRDSPQDPWPYVCGLSLHELSHSVIDGFGIVPWNETYHHSLMERAGLGAAIAKASAGQNYLRPPKDEADWSQNPRSSR